MNHTITRPDGQVWTLPALARTAGPGRNCTQRQAGRQPAGDAVQDVGGRSVGRRVQRSGRQPGQPREQERAKESWVDPGSETVCPLLSCLLVGVCTPSPIMHREEVSQPPVEAPCLRHLLR